MSKTKSKLWYVYIDWAEKAIRVTDKIPKPSIGGVFVFRSITPRAAARQYIRGTLESVLYNLKDDSQTIMDAFGTTKPRIIIE